jgi:uncharacterized protein (UPF0261 family)
MQKKVVMLGAFDTKGEVFSYLYDCLVANGVAVYTMDIGVMPSQPNFPVDFENTAVARAGGMSIENLRESNDRGKAVGVMGDGAAALLKELVAQNLVAAAIGMGGGGGTYMTLRALQEIPFGIPKLCMSTLAAKDLTEQMGVKDIVLMPSVVDVAGLNGISKVLIKQAAASIAAMATVSGDMLGNDTKRIAISMFGNTTACVDRCTEKLQDKGFEVMAFHATGIGGATMEALIREGCFDAVLDVTTTELADNLCGGICDAGPDRLTAAGEMGLPQVVVPGCLDMVNFAHLHSVPGPYKDRQLYSWAPDVTLMRTHVAENTELGEILVRKVAAAKGKAEIVIPLEGISQIDKAGDIFYAPEYDAALFTAIKTAANDAVKVTEYQAHINDPQFADALVTHLVNLLD